MANELENPTNESARSVLHALVLEDNPDDAQLCIRLLRKAYSELHCDVVRSSGEFEAYLRTHSYDIIIADYHMGVWTGLDAFHQMRDGGLDIPFILMTGALGDERAIECIKSGVTDYILKDRPDRLTVAIARALEEKQLRDQRRQAQYALEQNEAKFRMLAESIPAATFIEQGTHCCYVNRAAERITGYDREELLKMNFWDLILPDSRKAVIGRSTPQSDDDTPASRYEIQILNKQGEVRALDVTVGVFQNEGGLAALITAFDITDRSQAKLEVVGLRARESSPRRFVKHN